MKLSKNGVGFVVFILSSMGVFVSEGDLMTTFNTILQIGSGLLMAWNQWTRSDVVAFLFKK